MRKTNNRLYVKCYHVQKVGETKEQNVQSHSIPTFLSYFQVCWHAQCIFSSNSLRLSLNKVYNRLLTITKFDVTETI